MPIKNSSTPKKQTRRRPAAAPSRRAKQPQTIAELRRQAAHSLNTEKRTSEVLRLIASSSRDLQPVLDAVATSAAKLCDATDAVIFRIDGETARSVAWHGSLALARMRGQAF